MMKKKSDDSDDIEDSVISAANSGDFGDSGDSGDSDDSDDSDDSGDSGDSAEPFDDFDSDDSVDDTDVQLMVAFGMDDELVQTVGLDKAAELSENTDKAGKLVLSNDKKKRKRKGIHLPRSDNNDFVGLQVKIQASSSSDAWRRFIADFFISFENLSDFWCKASEVDGFKDLPGCIHDAWFTASCFGGGTCQGQAYLRLSFFFPFSAYA